MIKNKTQAQVQEIFSNYWMWCWVLITLLMTFSLVLFLFVLQRSLVTRIREFVFFNPITQV